jgi:penicillin-binding protein 1A
VTSQKTARAMMTMFRAVTSSGTASAAATLGVPVGGKTGTTSDFTDAWFIGFSPSVTCGVWTGYDNRRSLGDKETGARVALPIWLEFMKAAITGDSGRQFPGEGPDSQQMRAKR